MINVFATSHGYRLRNRRQASIDEMLLEAPLVYPNRAPLEVRILPKSYHDSIRDVIEDMPSKESLSTEDGEEDEIKLPMEMEKIKKAESIANGNIAVLNGVRNGPKEEDIFPIPYPLRPPIPEEEGIPLNNKMYTDIGRVQPINNYIQTRIPPPITEVPPRPIVRERKEEERKRPNKKVQEIPREPLLKDIKPEDGPNRHHWIIYFGHVLLQALTTLIDGTQAALKEYVAPPPGE